MDERRIAPCTVALVGCAHPHSRWHLTTLRHIPEVQRVLVWDENPALAAEIAREAGPGVAPCETLANLLDRDDVDSSIIALSNDQSAPMIQQLARSGKHVLCEKPMATSPAALQPAIVAARESGVTLGVIYPWRAHPVSRTLRRVIADGFLGRIQSVEVRMVTSQVRLRDPSHWLFDPARAGGGILTWLGCHFLDLLRFLLQDEVESVAGTVATLSGEPIGVEDTATFSLRFGGGALGTFHAGYLLPRSVAGYRGATYDTNIIVRGDLGNFAWEPTAREQVVRLESVHPEWAAAPERTLRFTLEPCDAYLGRHGLEFVREFLKACQTGSPPPATGLDGLRILEICAAAYRSSETGQRVAVGSADGGS